MPDEKKGGLGLLIGVSPKKPSSLASDMETDEAEALDTEAEDLAVDGILSAFEAKDSAGLKDALLTFLEAAGYSKQA